jgi:hypothetical protein
MWSYGFLTNSIIKGRLICHFAVIIYLNSHWLQYYIVRYPHDFSRLVLAQCSKAYGALLPDMETVAKSAKISIYI